MGDLQIPDAPLEPLQKAGGKSFLHVGMNCAEKPCFLRVNSQLKILFVVIARQQGRETSWLDIFPGSVLLADPAGKEDICALAARIGAENGIDAARTFFYASGADALHALRLAACVTGAWVCCHAPPINISTSGEIPLWGGGAPRFLAQDAAEDMPFFIGKGAPVYGLLPALGRAAWGRGRVSVRELLEKTLKLAGIGPLAEDGRILGRQIALLVSGTKGSTPQKAVFFPAGRTNIRQIELEPPFDWNANPFNDNNWVAQLQMWRHLDGFIDAYEKTSDKAWLDLPVRLIVDWHEYYRQNPPSAYVWSDMTTGMRAMKIAWFLALHHSGDYLLPRETLRIFNELARAHASFVMDEANIAWTNHTFSDLHGLMAIARVLPPVPGHGAMIFANRALEKLLGMQFTENGVHLENSPLYQQFGLSCVDKLLRTGWFDSPLLKQLAEKARNTLAWLRLPDGRLAPVGDTDNGAPQKNRPLAKGNIFNDSGYAIFRQAPASYLFFMCARNCRWHKHSDDLSLVWYDGCDILCDPGKYAYQESEQRSYVLATRAHNTLEINGRDEYSRGRPRRPRKPLTFVENAWRYEDFYLASAIMHIQEFDVTHRRGLIFAPGRFLVVSDAIYSTRIQDYNLHWHFHPSINLEKHGGGCKAVLADTRQAHISWHSSQSVTHRLARGETRPRLLGFFSQGYGNLAPAWCLEISAQCSCWNIVTAFSLDVGNSIQRIQRDSYILRHGKENFSIGTGVNNFFIRPANPCRLS